MMILKLKYSFIKCSEKNRSWVKDLDYRCYFDVVKKQFGNNDLNTQTFHFNKKWNPKHYEIIEFMDKNIGVISIIESDDNIFISEIIIDVPYQNQGHGTNILKYILNKNKKKSIKLKVLKENKAISLYKRFGFKKIDKDETHYIMELKL